MICTILGCGSSGGVPEIACDCRTCRSSNSKNFRTRSSIYIEYHDTKILVDTSTDLRQQALANDIKKVDAVIYTHDHSDHICGIDDVRNLLQNHHTPIPAFMSHDTAKTLINRFPYIFQSSQLYSQKMQSRIFDYEKFAVKDLSIVPLRQTHGKVVSTGLRFNDLAYLTDLNELPQQSIAMLNNLKVLILGCLRYSPAPTHLSFETAMHLIEQIRPQLTILTHMSHDIEYEDIKRKLPMNVVPAYDGMKIDIVDDI